ncbi:MAG: hypothetical protein AUK63_909 [bacterium P3]|nr:MAG: hypothetical protein AUK64_1066 [bacterium P201]KWW30463.1 MAG: hypothetical protein AUK63_909 [bacterium P3]KWW41350.1 MAG: hypothetical protein F083_1097 [bacterium F083]
MKRKKNIVVICIAAACAAIAAWVAIRGSRTSTFEQDFHIEDIASVCRVHISDKENNSVLLERIEGAPADSSWMVDGEHLASQPVVDLMLETLHSMRIRQQVNKNAASNVIKRISTSHVKVEVYRKCHRIDWFGGKLRWFPHEKLEATYYIGFETQDQMASYVYREGDKLPYIIHIPGFRGFLAPRFPTSGIAWRSHRIVALDIKHLARVELQIPASPEESFAIYRDGDDFRMELTETHRPVDGFDTARVAQMLSSFTNLNFDEFARAVPNTEFDSSLARTPRAILRITGTDGRTREVKTYIKYHNPDDLRAMPDPEMYEMFDVNRLYAVIDDSDTVLIQYFVFDNILQPASYFLGQAPSYFAR